MIERFDCFYFAEIFKYFQIDANFIIPWTSSSVLNFKRLIYRIICKMRFLGPIVNGFNSIAKLTQESEFMAGDGALALSK